MTTQNPIASDPPMPVETSKSSQRPQSFFLSLVFSFRNEQEVLPELIHRLQPVIKSIGCDYEMIFVNDASTDASLDLLIREREADPRIKIINTSRRFGCTQCVLAGFRHARGDVIVYMDTDLQDPPEIIPTLIQKWREGADIVHTTRTKRKGENAFKLWLTKQAYRMINFAAEDITILENTGDFKLISRRAFDELLKLKEYDPFLRGLVAWVGFRQTQVFYERDARFAGETHCSLWRTLNPYKEFLRGLTLFSSLPLYFALFAGFIVSIGAFAFLAYLILAYLFKKTLPYWSPLMVATLFLGSTILFTVGILGIYIGRMYREMKGRPHYIVESTIGFNNQAWDARTAVPEPSSH